jgi:tetratricopeptide (TPR) repeat protein
MKLSARLLFALVLPLSSSAVAAEARLDPANAWFKPALVENRSPLCPAVLEAANQFYYSSLAQLDGLPIVIGDLQAIDPEQDLPRERIVLPHPNTGEPMEETQAFVTTHGKKMYVSRRTNPGCGGSCETRQMLASLQPFDMPMHYEDRPGLSKPTPAVPELTLLKSRDDVYYVAVVNDAQLQLYTLTANAEWEGVCTADLKPKDLYSSSNVELQAAVKSLSDLRSTIEPIRQEAGVDCGTLRAHDRGTERLSEAFGQALYRPWALQGSGRKALGAPGDPLSDWSTLGIDEYAAVARYRAQLPVTVGQLARFYASGFGSPDTDASLAAEEVVAAAIRRGFGFASMSLFADKSARVRLAILENRPVADLEALNWQPAPQGEWWTEQESVLNVAVNHPAALRWLLSKHLDPNQANAFGKSPLMYAAQHNSLEAVRILLEHGANPNAATIFPDDTCTYTLRRANVTALHYAARYGSLDIVKALLDGGALAFVRTDEKVEQQPGQTALDWSRMYASPNIFDGDRPRLEQLLTPPGPRQLIEYAEQQTLQAEKQYAAGNLAAAHRSLKNALQASPSDARALSDMSLVALRAERYGESIEAATRLIAGSADMRLVANAWFNIGLACERKAPDSVSYNGELYCRSSGIFPFLQSWRAANSRARAEKLEQLFTASGRERCVVRQPDSTEHRYIFVRAADMDDNPYAQIQRIYVLHPAGSAISAAQIRWNVTPYAGTVRVPRPVTPRLVASHRLGSSTLTVLESEDGVQPPVVIRDYKCF